MFRLLMTTLLLVGCSQVEQEADRSAEPPTAAAAEKRQDTPRRIETQHLPNAVQVHAKVISGGLPEGDEAFAELRSLGVKTIISVDGMKPDVATAAKYGLRYVHLPHGYDGIPDYRVKELAKAVRELEGPIYIHCHHGKHRSPAAASVACVAAGLIAPSSSVPILKLAGTSPNYRGLYESAREVKPLGDALLDELEVEFPATAQVPPLAEAMVAMEHTHDNLRLLADSGWRTPTEHPDLDPPHEALLMREHFTELLRTEDVQRRPQAFEQLLRDSEQTARGLEEALRDWDTDSGQVEPPDAIPRLSARISENCKTCHEQFRDVPLGEK